VESLLTAFVSYPIHIKANPRVARSSIEDIHFHSFIRHSSQQIDSQHSMSIYYCGAGGCSDDAAIDATAVHTFWISVFLGILVVLQIYDSCIKPTNNGSGNPNGTFGDHYQQAIPRETPADPWEKVSCT
jgi:hypothetical protein